MATREKIADILAAAQEATDAHDADETGDIELLIDERDAWQQAADDLAELAMPKDTTRFRELLIQANLRRDLDVFSTADEIDALWDCVLEAASLLNEPFPPAS